MGGVTSRASISTVLVRPLARALEGVPGALSELFAATDLTPEMLADAEARVSPAQFCVAWAEAVRLSGDPTLSLRIARATPPGAFGIVEYVCRSAATLRDALTQWCRFLGILDSAVEVGLVDVGSQTALRVITESEAPAPASHELCFALVVERARAMLPGPLGVAEVRFTHRVGEPEASRHRAFFGARVRFGARHTELVFDRDVLAVPLVTADPNLLEILLPAAEGKRGQPSPEALLADQVRRALRAALCRDDANLDAIARRLGLTGRSLQRRLRDEGTSFQAVRDEIRRELADRYLGEGMSLAEISFLLGFSEPSAFFRAFKRWTGRTPLERRAERGRTDLRPGSPLGVGA
jgi:AraC-like DNA-binding protein